MVKITRKYSTEITHLEPPCDMAYLEEKSASSDVLYFNNLDVLRVRQGLDIVTYIIEEC